MILDYTHAEGGARSQSMTTANRHYTVETVGIFDGVDKSTVSSKLLFGNKLKIFQIEL